MSNKASGKTQYSPAFGLNRDQLEAVLPDRDIVLRASAGSGKTQVLTARIKRLLLGGVRPENILALTFTKAGASEMVNRLNRDLAEWVTMDAVNLSQRLKFIGAPVDPDSRLRARQLFTELLDAPGGGIAIQTIHSFCQSLLGAFPAEADVRPGIRAIEEYESEQLAQRALVELLQDARQNGDQRTLDNFDLLVDLLDEESMRKWLKRCVAALDDFERLSGNFLPFINQSLGLAVNVQEQDIAVLCMDDKLPKVQLEQIITANQSWLTKAGKPQSAGEKGVEQINDWLSLSSQMRLENIDSLFKHFRNGDGGLQQSERMAPINDEYLQISEQVYVWILQIIERMKLIELSDQIARCIELGRAYANHARSLKSRMGVMDYDDMIRLASKLLTNSEMRDWVRFKLDRRYDHILIDESQDTNQHQWDIIRTLIEDFYAGQGSKEGLIRTFFSVGDFKQAIYGFQGTDPKIYAQNVQQIEDDAIDANKNWHGLTLNQSFRSSQRILDMVDKVFKRLGDEALGLRKGDYPQHLAHDKDLPGRIELWAPICNGKIPNGLDMTEDMLEQLPILANIDSQNDDQDEDDDYISEAERLLADKIARKIANWLQPGHPDRLWLAGKIGGVGRWVKPGDILILLRSRGEKAQSLVARLHGHGVAVAGLDRLRLNQPLVIRDLLAAIKFALQPHDDLNLASLLVSPLIGWSQLQLMEQGWRGHKADYRAKGTSYPSLWDYLRGKAKDDDARQQALEPLFQILAMADYGTVYDFIETLLSGSLQGRAKLIARLGDEILDPLAEFANIAQAFMRQQGGGLQQFLHWFEARDEEIKREFSGTANAVRVMTAHGAKGLESPVVILADSFTRAINPSKPLTMELPVLPDMGDAPVHIPIWGLTKAQRLGPLQELYDARERKELEEHWRLLYVAMTRAEQQLYIGGVFKSGNKTDPELAEDSWYHPLLNAMRDMGCQWQIGEGGLDGMPYLQLQNYHQPGRPPIAADSAIVPDDPHSTQSLPDWALRQLPLEQKPPDPLAPSRRADEGEGEPPAIGQDRQAAARRGIAMHSLFERLPDVAMAERRAAADRWLERQAGFDQADQRIEMIEAVMRVLDHPDWADIFAASALAEAPISAVVGEQVISGTIDRLLIGSAHIRIIDFKNTLKLPANIEAISNGYIRQMAAYRAALAAIYPDHAIEVALLYTAGPKLFVLPDQLLDLHHPAKL